MKNTNNLEFNSVVTVHVQKSEFTTFGFFIKAVDLVTARKSCRTGRIHQHRGHLHSSAIATGGSPASSQPVSVQDSGSCVRVFLFFKIDEDICWISLDLFFCLESPQTFEKLTSPFWKNQTETKQNKKNRVGIKKPMLT